MGYESECERRLTKVGELVSEAIKETCLALADQDGLREYCATAQYNAISLLDTLHRAQRLNPEGKD